MSLNRITIVLIASATMSSAELSGQTLFGGRLGAYVEQEALFLGGEGHRRGG